jgi:hypothetical protein
MADKEHFSRPDWDLQVARLVRARRALRWRLQARFPAQRLLDRLQGRCVPAPQFERCRARVELLRGLLARAGIHPDAPDVARQLADRRRPDLSSVPGRIHRTLRALLSRARPLAPGSYGADADTLDEYAVTR